MSIQLSTGALASMLSNSSFQDVFADSVMCIYSGRQPVSADDSEVGVLLAEITIDGGGFTAGGTGLNFKEAVGGLLEKEDAEVWKGLYLEESSLGWFRLYDNDKVEGASLDAKRLDGSIGTSRSDIIVNTVKTTVGGSMSFETFKLNFSVV